MGVALGEERNVRSLSRETNHTDLSEASSKGPADAGRAGETTWAERTYIR